MANIPSVNPFAAVGQTVLTPVAVGLSNTLSFDSSKRQVLFIENASGSSITATLDGSDAPATVKVEGTGSTFNTSTGAVLTVGAGAKVAIPLANFRTYLKGAVTLDISLATSVTAWMLEF